MRSCESSDSQGQISQVEMLRDSARSVMRRHMVQAMQVVRTASELLDSDAPDLDAYEARFREATDLSNVAAGRATPVAAPWRGPQCR